MQNFRKNYWAISKIIIHIPNTDFRPQMDGQAQLLRTIYMEQDINTLYSFEKLLFLPDENSVCPGSLVYLSCPILKISWNKENCQVQRTSIKTFVLKGILNKYLHTEKTNIPLVVVTLILTQEQIQKILLCAQKYLDC